MLPLAIILGSLPLFRNSYGYTIYIEEPEAHLFPSAQKRIVELIAVIYKSIPSVQFVITTGPLQIQAKAKCVVIRSGSQ
jgi:predicted ATPase